MSTTTNPEIPLLRTYINYNLIHDVFRMGPEMHAQGMTAIQFATLASIVSFMAAGADSCYAGLPAIAASACTSVSSVKRALPGLQQVGYLSVEHRINQTSLYTHHLQQAAKEVAPDVDRPAPSADGILLADKLAAALNLHELSGADGIRWAQGIDLLTAKMPIAEITSIICYIAGHDYWRDALLKSQGGTIAAFSRFLRSTGVRGLRSQAARPYKASTYTSPTTAPKKKSRFLAED